MGYQPDYDNPALQALASDMHANLGCYCECISKSLQHSYLFSNWMCTQPHPDGKTSIMCHMFC